jgi:hypothetical protein
VDNQHLVIIRNLSGNNKIKNSISVSDQDFYSGKAIVRSKKFQLLKTLKKIHYDHFRNTSQNISPKGNSIL